MELEQTVRFRNTDCAVEIKQVPKRNTEIKLLNNKTGEPVAIATARLEQVLIDGMVYIKDYSENEGMLETLVKAKIVSEPVTFVLSGFVKIPVCKLLVTE